MSGLAALIADDSPDHLFNRWKHSHEPILTYYFLLQTDYGEKSEA